jgi:predicted dehydrogenase
MGEHMNTKKRYALVGLGDRANMYVKALTEDFTDTCELVGLCDANEGRVKLRADWVREHGKEISTYNDTQFDQMIAETRPDVVVVLTKDCMHDDYICRAMEAGCDAITEKPMTTDEKKS